MRRWTKCRNVGTHIFFMLKNEPFLCTKKVGSGFLVALLLFLVSTIRFKIWKLLLKPSNCLRQSILRVLIYNDNAKNAIIQLLHIKLWHVKSRNWPYNEINDLWFRYRYDMNYLRTYTLLIFQKLSNDLCELIHIPHTFDLFSLIDALENVLSASFSRSLRARKLLLYTPHCKCKRII